MWHTGPAGAALRVTSSMRACPCVSCLTPSCVPDLILHAAQRAFNSKQEWVQPTAVMASSFYLCLEAQLSGEIAFAAFTQIAAILVLDYMNRPWNRVGMNVRVVVTPEGRNGASLTELSKSDSDSKTPQ
jgi:hypothetical protein